MCWAYGGIGTTWQLHSHPFRLVLRGTCYTLESSTNHSAFGMHIPVSVALIFQLLSPVYKRRWEEASSYIFSSNLWLDLAIHLHYHYFSQRKGLGGCIYNWTHHHIHTDNMQKGLYYASITAKRVKKREREIIERMLWEKCCRINSAEIVLIRRC